MKKIQFFALSFFSFMYSLSAQDDGKPALIELQFVSFPKISSPDPIQLYLGDGEAVEVVMPTNSFSNIYKVKAKENWRLGKLEFDEEGNPLFSEYGKVKSTGGQRQLILATRKGQKDSDGLILAALNGDDKNFGKGKCIVVNYTVTQLKVNIGGVKFALNPKSKRLFKPGVSQEKGDRKVAHAYFAYKDNKGRFRPFNTGTWRLNDAVRTMAFVYHDPSTKQIRIHTIRDYLP